ERKKRRNFLISLSMFNTKFNEIVQYKEKNKKRKIEIVANIMGQV
ncbi:hypothetical protein DOY81_010748, partial [Sarcophaga bullata]